MIKVFGEWYHRYLSDPQAVVLALLLVAGFTIVITMGNMLAPALAALVLAYLLEGLVRFLQRQGARRFRAVILVFCFFMAFLVLIIFGLGPLVSEQLTQFFREVPGYLTQAQQAMLQLPEHVPYISEEQIRDFSKVVNTEIATFSQKVLSISISSIPGMITVTVYAILVPLLIFFFLKDKEQLLRWFSSCMPTERRLMSQVWNEVDQQIGNYVRGKFWEILVVGSVTFIAFAVLGLKYGLLLASLVGLSVLIPYIGAAVVTIPVAAMAYFQWGVGPDFWTLVIVYLVIQALDGNILVPLLFSEVVNLHPVAIILSILVFGGLWGFWGIFFAIPLATLVNALLSAWPRIGAKPSTADTGTAA